ncbi:MAG: DUF2793 domain-containing protein [Alsobacter sp.]
MLQLAAAGLFVAGGISQPHPTAHHSQEAVMADTTRLGLPLLAAAQAQKHVTHNEALQLLDSLVHLAVSARGVAAPPAAPADGDRVIVGGAPTGAFAGEAGKVAAFDDGAWRFLQPRAGWIAHVASEGVLLLHDGTAWRALETALHRLADLDGLGVGTVADATNRLAVRSDAVLLSARDVGEGGGSLRLVLNRTAPAGAASQLFQTGWSARAETGLTGDDRWRLRVTPDGTRWRDAVVADPQTGAVAFPGGVSDWGAGAVPALRNLVINGDFAIAQRGSGPFALAGPAVFGFDRWLVQAAAAVSGTLARTALAPGSSGPAGRFFATLAVTATTASASPELQSRIEDVARLAGRTVTLSFWYRTASPSVVVEAGQRFGEGGAAVVTGIGQANLQPALAWTRRTLVLALPSLASRNVGPGSSTVLRFVITGSAAASLDIADVQLEEGAFATPFERRSPALELLLVRRFFRRSAVALPAADLAAEMAAPPSVSGTGPFDYAAEI